ncbi:DUF624 domain-containing protein [Gracilibacillus sp. S3-1-1]|uniref:DUF624 domain-containing protein n=1 Tax=Gracilibacillus pellucidus TaxID=3095368 RepID=A0ACC6M823_9BACI|nr:DUF624 domain-containing protein [Gracilibacillus sp. S3-1-1]MDX8047140.1 DUF624 domain-containing protein [Gracilibacillus sp. S3-1-1]
MNRTYVFADWILEMLILHMYWMLYTLKGGVIFGIFPSTAATYAVIRNWMLHGRVKGTASLFKKYYRENFKASNLLGWMLMITTLTLALNLYIIPFLNDTVRLIMYSVLIFIFVIVVIQWLYVFPMLVHYSLSIANYFVANMRIGLTSFSAIIMQCMIIAIYGLLLYIAPALLIIFGIIPIAFVQIAISSNVFDRLQARF